MLVGVRLKEASTAEQFPTKRDKFELTRTRVGLDLNRGSVHTTTDQTTSKTRGELLVEVGHGNCISPVPDPY